MTSIPPCHGAPTRQLSLTNTALCKVKVQTLTDVKVRTRAMHHATFLHTLSRAWRSTGFHRRWGSDPCCRGSNSTARGAVCKRLGICSVGVLDLPLVVSLRPSDPGKLPCPHAQRAVLSGCPAAAALRLPGTAVLRLPGTPAPTAKRSTSKLTAVSEELSHVPQSLGACTVSLRVAHSLLSTLPPRATAAHTCAYRQAGDVVWLGYTFHGVAPLDLHTLTVLASGANRFQVQGSGFRAYGVGFRF